MWHCLPLHHPHCWSQSSEVLCLERWLHVSAWWLHRCWWCHGGREPGCWPRSTALGVTREGSCRSRAACMALWAWRHSVPGRADVGQAGPVRQQVCCFQLFKKKERKKKKKPRGMSLPSGLRPLHTAVRGKPLASVLQPEFWQ